MGVCFAFLENPNAIGNGSSLKGAVSSIKAGDKVPSITIDQGFNPIGKVNMQERTKGRNVIIMGLPGAFTPC
jgi:2-Cys peroxiredoxin 5